MSPGLAAKLIHLPASWQGFPIPKLNGYKKKLKFLPITPPPRSGLDRADILAVKLLHQPGKPTGVNVTKSN
jgi:hypothetical protein